MLYVFKKAAQGRKKKQNYKIWQDEFHPKAVYSEKWFLQKLQYIHNNPARKGFVTKPEDWKYSSARLRNYLIPKLLFENGIIREALLHNEEAQLLKFFPSQAQLGTEGKRNR